jgi:hypothetical protein
MGTWFCKDKKIPQYCECMYPAEPSMCKALQFNTNLLQELQNKYPGATLPVTTLSKEEKILQLQERRRQLFKFHLSPESVVIKENIYKLRNRENGEYNAVNGIKYMTHHPSTNSITLAIQCVHHQRGMVHYSHAEYDDPLLYHPNKFICFLQDALNLRENALDIYIILRRGQKIISVFYVGYLLFCLIL